jgi:hypothetical protein
MPRLELLLAEFPDGPAGGPRLLGRLRDPDLIDLARERLTEAARRRLRRLRQLQPVPAGEEPDA